MGCTGEIRPTSEKDKIKSVCIDGVEYIYFKGSTGYGGWGYMSVKFNRDSTVSLCETIDE